VPEPSSNPPPETAAPERGHSRWALLAVLALALGLRLAALVQFADVQGLHGDEIYYARMARSIVAGEGHPGSVRPPLHPLFLAAPFALTGGSLLAARLAQIALSLGTVLLVHRLAARSFGARAGLFAAAAAAVAPGLVHYTHFLWSEGLASFLLVLALTGVDGVLRGGRRGTALWTGLALGLLILTRESWLAFAAPVCLWIGLRAPGPPRERRIQAALVAAACLGPILPWTIRNVRLHGELVLVSTNRWYPIGWGNVYPEDGWYLGTEVERESGFLKNPPDLKPISEAAPPLFRELECQAYWKEIATERIRAEQPTWLFEKLLRNGARLFYTGTQALRFRAQGWVETSAVGGWLLVLGDVLGTWLVVSLGILGLAWARATPLRMPALLAIGSLLAVHVIANAVPRFAVPLQAVLAVYAGAIAARALEEHGDRIGPRARVIGVACVSLYLLVPLPLTWQHLRMIADVLTVGSP